MAQDQRTRFDDLSCSFCAKSPKQVLKLIAGPGTYICDECVALCVRILVEEVAPEAGEEAAASALRLYDEFEAMRQVLLDRRQSP